MMPAPDHWLVVPIVLPLMMGALLLVVERVRPAWQAPMSLAATLALAVLAFRLVAFADADRIGVYLLGNWQAPFGIVLVLDRLAAMMLALTSVIALASLAASLRLAEQGPHFHAFFQLQLAGLNGAFLTGDVFNLFVFFEVLLIASYALLLHGAGGRALRSGLHYVVINLIGASLFLVAASLLYGVAGTLNFADLAVKLPALPEWDAGLARAAALLLLAVFGVKAAVLPLGFWLPETYGVAPGPVAALFAIMTKVGIYAIIRVSFTVFGGDGWMADWGEPALFALGVATIIFGTLGALATRRLVTLVAYLVLISSGMLIAAMRTGQGGAGRRAVLSGAHDADSGRAVPRRARHRRPARIARRPLRQWAAAAAAGLAGRLVPCRRGRRRRLAAVFRIHRQSAHAASVRQRAARGVVLGLGARQRTDRDVRACASGEQCLLEDARRGRRTAVARRRPDGARSAGRRGCILDGRRRKRRAVHGRDGTAIDAAGGIRRRRDARTAGAAARGAEGTMKRLLPHPLLSLVLWLGWLALNNSIAPAHILLGAMLG